MDVNPNLAILFPCTTYQICNDPYIFVCDACRTIDDTVNLKDCYMASCYNIGLNCKVVVFLGVADNRQKPPQW